MSQEISCHLRMADFFPRCASVQLEIFRLMTKLRPCYVTMETLLGFHQPFSRVLARLTWHTSPSITKTAPWSSAPGLTTRQRSIWCWLDLRSTSRTSGKAGSGRLLTLLVTNTTLSTTAVRKSTRISLILCTSAVCRFSTPSTWSSPVCSSPSSQCWSSTCHLTVVRRSLCASLSSCLWPSSCLLSLKPFLPPHWWSPWLESTCCSPWSLSPCPLSSLFLCWTYTTALQRHTPCPAGFVACSWGSCLGWCSWPDRRGTQRRWPCQTTFRWWRPDTMQLILQMLCRNSSNLTCWPPAWCPALPTVSGFLTTHSSPTSTTSTVQSQSKMQILGCWLARVTATAAGNRGPANCPQTQVEAVEDLSV